jgi:MerR family redox-sensitive transcriptional activator SoxR
VVSCAVWWWIEETEMAEGVEMAIGQIARQVYVAPSAIWYYEEIGLLPPARVNGRRRYNRSTVQSLGVIERAQQAGFTLGEIRELFFGFAVGTPPAARWEALARRKLAEIDRGPPVRVFGE